jgi:ketosteroid isomerase-like protein
MRRTIRSNRLLVLLVFSLLAACSRTPDDERIRQTIAAMQQAMEQREPRTFMAHVADDFVGRSADFDRNALHNLLRAEVLRNDDIGVMLGPIDVDVQGDRASVRVTATFTGGSGGLLPEHGAIYAIDSGWRKEGSQWRCINARWEQKM